MASVSEMNRKSKRRIASSIKPDCLRAPKLSDLEEQFREWQRLRKQVDKLEKRAEQNVSEARSNLNQKLTG